LATLLLHHVTTVEPDIHVVRVVGWPRKKECPNSYEWLAKEGWHFEEKAVLIVDEAQGSYWDTIFWNDNKAINSSTPYRVITFASFGSAGYNVDNEDTPGIAPIQTVSLTPPDTGDGIRVGLLLSQEEFSDFVVHRFAGHRFDTSMTNSIFDFTNGHVGACADLLAWIQGHDVSLPL
jgi:hypothetical protein